MDRPFVAIRFLVFHRILSSGMVFYHREWLGARIAQLGADTIQMCRPTLIEINKNKLLEYR